jgi:hypothetical protein
MKMMISIAYDKKSMDMTAIVTRPVIGFILRSVHLLTKQCPVGSQF